MKTRMILSLFIAAAVGMASCGDDRETVYAPENVQVDLSVTEKDLSADADTFSVDVKAAREFAAYSTADWLKVTPEGSVKKNETLTVAVQENADNSGRSGEVVVWSGGTRRSVKVNQAGKRSETDIVAPEGYSLVWNDEFDGTELGSDWTFEIAGPGFVNNELQNYVKGKDVAEVSDGTLKIHLHKDGSDIRSARIYAKRSQGWRYGYIEASIRLPEGKGTWPAFWMMPVNFKTWPGDGEIDIMESVGYDPGSWYLQSTATNTTTAARRQRAHALQYRTLTPPSTGMPWSGHRTGWCSMWTESGCLLTTTTAQVRTPGPSTHRSM